MKKKQLLAYLLALNVLMTTGCINKKDNTNKTDKENVLLEETIDKAENQINDAVKNLDEVNDQTLKNQKYEIAFLNESITFINNKNEPFTIEPYEKVIVLSRNQIESHIKYYDYDFIVPNSILETLPDLFVEVDISEQIVRLYKDNELYLESSIVTGKDSTPTRIGYFDVDFKTKGTYLTGPGYKSWVDYWMPFDGGIGLHDASWRSEFGGEIYRQDGSHGCVNLPSDIAKEIYENIETGTHVLVHK